jgi:hypothetical protein
MRYVKRNDLPIFFAERRGQKTPVQGSMETP